MCKIVCTYLGCVQILLSGEHREGRMKLKQQTTVNAFFQDCLCLYSAQRCAILCRACLLYLVVLMSSLEKSWKSCTKIRCLVTVQVANMQTWGGYKIQTRPDHTRYTPNVQTIFRARIFLLNYLTIRVWFCMLA